MLGRRMTGEPNPETDPESKAEHYEKETRAVEAQDNLNTAKDRIANPPSVVEARLKQEEDLTQRAKDAEDRARAAEDKIRTASEEAKKEAERVAGEAQQAAQQAKEELHNHQLSMVTEKLDEVLKSRKSPQEQFTEYFAFADQMAEKMGWVKPGTLPPASDNPQIALELAKINIEAAQRQQEHERQLAKDKREWDLELIKLNDTRTNEARKLDLEEKRTEMFMAAPQALGAALIRGAMDREGGGAAREVTQQPEHRIEMSEAQSGEVECPTCQTLVGVGPTTTVAECVKCHTKYPVVRFAAQEPKPPGEE